jgi:hypothetical protein
MSEPIFDLDQLREPVLIGVRDYWQDISGGRPLPARHDFDPLDIPHLLPHIVLFDVFDDPPSFRFRLVGTASVFNAGVDPTGQIFDEMPHSGTAVARMRQGVELRKPYFTDDVFPWGARPNLHYRTLVMPLSDDGDAVDMLLAATVIREESQVRRLDNVDL